MRLNTCVFLLTFFVLVNIVKTDYFTSVVGLEKLLHSKIEVVKAIEDYLTAEEDRLRMIKLKKEEFRTFIEKAAPNWEEFLQNPVNAYLLVKRLNIDWKNLEQLMINSRNDDSIDILKKKIRFPDDDDLAGAAEGLVRLQKMYKLNTTSLADGYILNKFSSQKLTADDCFEVGRHSYSVGDFYYTCLWMREALKRLDSEITESTNREELLELLAYSTYMKGDIEEALKYTLQLLEIAPENSRAQNNKQYFEVLLLKDEIQSTKKIEENSSSDSEYEKYQKLTEKLCRGEQNLSIEEQSKLKCRLFTNNDGYLILQPLKEEELYLRPRIVVYHDFMTETEMETIKRLAKPNLKRAAVSSRDERGEEFSNTRISKSAWLKDSDHSIVDKLSFRIQCATGLSLLTAEELQVLNYGIGGHYEAHFDYSREDEAINILTKHYGDRVATWLNYMSDVEAGGATVFPEIGISVQPEKGSSLLWYNLHSNGTGDYRTRHAACPVLLGSKWVSNKWIRERGQEFRRPCSLNNE
ncbi:prolyl 4-hydroxylase subunit alpha-1-like [Centruroides vittatus]|uniref:prolyl 4-hydroxylase subunit alpha-1-like n=1 Tax=Centruroides vittatus TaxID=120091 RepID=UPI00351084C4